jgi:hypothetical protein
MSTNMVMLFDMPVCILRESLAATDLSDQYGSIPDIKRKSIL